MPISQDDARKATEIQLEVVRLLSEQDSPKEVLSASGLSHQTVYHWRKAKWGASVGNILALLNAMGYELTITKMVEKDA